jgi:translation initiation factor IF-3
VPIKEGVRVNNEIGVPQVRVIGEDGNQVGIMDTSKALAMARQAGLDLVEVAPSSKPPVCRIIDYGKYRYKQSKRAKEARKKQHVTHIKELKVRPKIEEHDYQFKVKHAREFLTAGNKVKLTVVFRGRELYHVEFGEKILQRMAEDLNEVAQVERETKLEGRNLVMIVAPK